MCPSVYGSLVGWLDRMVEPLFYLFPFNRGKITKIFGLNKFLTFKIGYVKEC